MSCQIYYNSELPADRPQVKGTPSHRPASWRVSVAVTDTDGTVHRISARVLHRVRASELPQIMGGLIDELAADAGGVASFVEWRALGR